MRTWFALGIVLALLASSTHRVQAQPQASYPCSVVLRATMKEIPNAQGVALITKVRKPYAESATSPVRERQSVGIYADWLPSPSVFGEYDRYEGFAQVPGEISWRFTMHPVKENTPSWFGGTPWVGKFDEISQELPLITRVEVRLSNTGTQELGPVVLQNTLQACGSS
ncbi:hypothetical protein RAC89_30310 [Paenibacillus sp. GD4]|uniref:hypothetical protein n=1 Tax=Paenibacillus sp. GD4 TaxID=3068890 RepID=UPI00279681E1|nr:hypothetical protein [Paenibacillus sp. GD4]MDQ1914679.1 hypothetical protein [Paenibacillus sp. GD4]